MNRTTLRTAIGAIAAAALLTLTACSGGQEPITANGDPETTPAANASGPDGKDVTVDEDGVNWCENVEVDSFEDIDKISAQDFADAYCELITFNGEMGMTSLAMSADSFNENEMLVFQDWMSTAAYEGLDKTFQAYRKNPTEEGWYSINMLTGFNMDTGGFKFADEMRLTDYRGWSEADYDIASDDVNTGQDRVSLRITFTDDLLVKPDGEDEAVVVPMTREVEFLMSRTENDEHPWVIDAWDGNLQFADETRAPRDTEATG